MERCARCVLTENHPGIWFDENHVCNYCLEFDGRQPPARRDREQELVEILRRHADRGEYDCLMMLSGGKNSVYVLHLLKKRYNLRVLAFTFDNGFESPAALENVRRAVDSLQVDSLYFRAAHMKRLFQFLLQNRVKPVVFCPICKSVTKTTAWEVAKKLGIGLVVWGDTKGQFAPMHPAQPNLQSMVRSAAIRLSSVPEFRPYWHAYFNKQLIESEEMENIRSVSPLHYVTWEADRALRIVRDTGWKPPAADYPGGATNCLMNLVVCYASRLEYGFSIYDTEMSALIRHGEMTRQEALDDLEVPIDPNLVEEVLSQLGLSLDDLELPPLSGGPECGRVVSDKRGDARER